MVTGSVLGSLSASLLVVSQLECPVSFFGAASTSAPPYKADPGRFRHCPYWSPFTTRGSVRGRVFYFPPIPGESPPLDLASPCPTWYVPRLPCRTALWVWVPSINSASNITIQPNISVRSGHHQQYTQTILAHYTTCATHTCTSE